MSVIQSADFKDWILPMIGFFLCWGILAFSKKLLWRRLVRWAKKTPSNFDNELLENLKVPLRVFVLFLALELAYLLAPRFVKSFPELGIILKIFFVLVLLWVLERAVKSLINSNIIPPSFSQSARSLMMILVRVLFVSLCLLFVLDTLGISITPLLASLGVGSVAVALALQDTLSNFFSGVYILIDKPIRIGDFIKINDIEGRVAKIGWRSTHINLLANNSVVIPNSKIASSQLTNFDLPDLETAVLVQMGVAYESDLELVEKVTIEVATEILKTVPGGVSTFTPFIRYHTFSDSSINFTIILRAQQFTDNYLLTHEFIKAVHKKYQERGITIPYPQRTIHTVQNV